MIEVLATLAAVAVAFFLANALVRYVFGVSLACYIGLHRWYRVPVGRGRDASYVVMCKACEILRDEN